MIKEEELLDAIAECQGQRNPNANTCSKLASYYVILDHMKKDEKAEPVVHEYSYAPPPISYESDSEFGRKVRNLDPDEVMALMDELMETLAVLYPRLYEGVMSKL